MSERDYNRQAVKGEGNLGCRSGRRERMECSGVHDKEGNVLDSCAKLYNSREGFEQFVKMTEGIKQRLGMKDKIQKGTVLFFLNQKLEPSLLSSWVIQSF